MPVIAILDKARIGDTQSILTAIQATTTAMDNLYSSRHVAFITGGYKGADDDVYGYTRIGYERAKDLVAYSLIVMPSAGDSDSHKDAEPKKLSAKCGEMTLLH